MTYRDHASCACYSDLVLVCGSERCSRRFSNQPWIIQWTWRRPPAKCSLLATAGGDAKALCTGSCVSDSSSFVCPQRLARPPVLVSPDQQL
jgi:hypothetical protein